MVKKLPALRHSQRLLAQRIMIGGLCFGIAAMSLGVYLRSTQAASVAATAQAEAATVAGAASKVSQSAASGGSAVMFGGSPYCVTPSSLTLKDQYTNPPDPPPPWKRYANQKVTVYFQTSALNTEYRNYVNVGARNWTTTACINAVSVLTCPSGTYCVPIRFVSEPGGARGTTYYTSSGGYARNVEIEMNTAVLNGTSTAQRQVTTMHEMGHAIGLDHRANSNALMYGAGSRPTASLNPDANDIHNLLVFYGPQRFAPPRTGSPNQLPAPEPGEQLEYRVIRE